MRASLLYKQLHVWRLRHLSEQSFTLVLSGVVGLLAGLAAVLLKTLVHLVNRALLDFHPPLLSGNLLMLLYPFLGIGLTILFVRFILRGEIGHGLPSVLFAISRKKGELPPKNMYASLVASTLTVAFGGSVGLEAPIASTGSAIGSNIGRLCRLSPRYVKLLLGCGAAGAIAGIFKAPLAGVLFTIEVLMFDMTMSSAIPLLISALCASCVSYFLMGNEVQFAFAVTDAFTLRQIPFYCLLGLFCALTSVYFLRTTDRVEEWFARRRSWVHKWLIGGLTLGLLIFLFPPLFGEGYGNLSALLNGTSDTLFAHTIYGNWSSQPWMVLLLLLLLILLKPVATAATIGSGGVGGTFGPSLILGGLSGYCIALLCNLLGLPPQSAANFALVGMGAVMTGVMHAPFMGVFLIAEITGGYALMIPLLITATVTYICVNPFEQHSIYARKLAAKGDLLTHDKDASAWQLMEFNELIETNFITLPQRGTLRHLVEAIKQSSRNLFPVLDEQQHLVGVIVLDDVRGIIFDADKYDTVSLRQLMHPLEEGDLIHQGDSLTEVVEKFHVGERYNLVVVDSEGRYIGFVSRANTFSAYRRFISEQSEE